MCESVDFACRNSRHYQAVDLAWDSTPILKQNIPLLLYAQGKIDLKRCSQYLADIDKKYVNKFAKTDDKNNVIAFDVPRLFESTINLVRSFLTRRVSAQSARFSNFYPYFKYDPRGVKVTDKLKSDVLSQRIDIMVEQFGYRPFFSEQTVRDMFLYGYSLVFPTCRWVEHKQLVPRNSSESVPESLSSEEEGEIEEDTKIEKEGVEFTNPHPLRQMWNRAYPLSQINNDLGPDWVGYWDVIRFYEIRKNKNYWNRDRIKFSSKISHLLHTHKAFFDYYFDQPCRMNFPEPSVLQGEVGFDNDAKENLGAQNIYYSRSHDEAPIFIAIYFEKINPKDLGVADYPYDVWVRLQVTSEETVVAGEFLPSIPAMYGGLNQNDSKVLNNSMAHDIMSYQDQVSNILSQMLLNIKAGLLKIYIFNKDVLDEEVQQTLKQDLKGENYYVNPQALFVSMTKMNDMGMDVAGVMRVVESQISTAISDAIRSITQLISLAERMLAFSPQEGGQPAPREISAREVQEIATTTNDIFTAITDSIDEQRAAVKFFLYESLVCCSNEKLEVPTLGRYTQEAVKDAGFEVVESKNSNERDVIRRNILGNTQDLRHDVLFTSRDGLERFSNNQAAQTLVQLVGNAAQIPQVIQKMGDAKLFEMFNEIFRLAGADVVLESDEEITPSVEQRLVATLQQLEQRMVAVEGNAGIESPSPEGAGGEPPPAQAAL